MGHSQNCPNCKKSCHWDSSEIFTLKSEIIGSKEIPYPTEEELDQMDEDEREEWEEIILIGAKQYESILGMKSKFGVICPHCNKKIIIRDDFNEGYKPSDVWNYNS